MNIQELISQAGKHLRSEFELIKESNPHFAERGAETEIILKNFLNSHLPKRFAADSGIVIDEKNHISAQTDVIIYDALNSPIYRKGDRVLILPSDNVAAVIEVKSRLSKTELEDAATKISSVKKLEKTPVTSADQPVTFSPLISTKTLGVVFAYDSLTSLETLAGNLREINQSMPSDNWIDIVVVLDKGVIGYTLQLPFSRTFPGWFAGACSKDFTVHPFYIHLIKEDLGDLTLNRFFVNLMAHLTFYRKRTTNFMGSVMGNHAPECMTLQGYQYNLNRELVPCEEQHQEGNLLKYLVKFNLYSTKDGKYIGQLAWMPWQDGASITYSGFYGPPELFFRPFFEFTKTKGSYIQGREDASIWLSSVLPLSKNDFIKQCEQFKGDIVAKYYEGNEDGPPPLNLEEYEKRNSKKGMK